MGLMLAMMEIDKVLIHKIKMMKPFKILIHQAIVNQQTECVMRVGLVGVVMVF